MKRVIKTRVVLVAVVGAVLISGSMVGAAQPGSSLALDGQVDADLINMRIDLFENGSAAWTLEYWVRLRTENETAAFDSLEADIRDNRSGFEDRFGDRMRSTVRAAENATGRAMSVHDLSVRTERREIPERYGLVIYELTWTAFAAEDDGGLAAGDAIAGLYLTEDTTLRLDWPADYRATSITPEADESAENSVIWRGPENFGADEPRLRLAVGTPTGTASATDLTESPGPDGQGDLPIGLLVGGVVVLIAIGAAGWIMRGRGTPTPAEREPTEEPAAEAPPEDPAPSDELLSNEERVLRLLERYDGRMKQQAVAEELDWTDAKTSQVVGSLRDAGDLEGFRLGRENVLTLPEEDGPPADDAGEDNT